MSKYMFRRYLLFVVSLFINAFGIAFITKALLVTYVLSMFTPFTMGVWTILLNLLFVVLELFLMTRKDLKEDLRMYLLQIPVSFCFGLFIDFSMMMLSWLTPASYASQVVDLLIGCTILALGIALEVKANAAMMAGEYFVKAITRRFRGDFGYVKLGFDITLLGIACTLSLVFMSGIYGVREGTARIIVSWTSGLQTLSVVGKKVRNGVKTLSSPLRGNMEVAGTSWAKCLPRSWASNCMTMNLFAWQPNGVEWMSSIS